MTDGTVHTGAHTDTDGITLIGGLITHGGDHLIIMATTTAGMILGIMDGMTLGITALTDMAGMTLGGVPDIILHTVQGSIQYLLTTTVLQGISITENVKMEEHLRHTVAEAAAVTPEEMSQ